MLDYSEKRENSFDLIPDGSYEVICAKCEQETKVWPSGESYNQISLQWKIRDDVDQGSQGRVIFDDIRQNPKDPSHPYNDAKIYSIVWGGQSSSNPKSKYTFEDYDDLCLHLNGICMKIDVGHYTSKNGKTYNEVKIGGYHPSNAMPQVVSSSASAPVDSSIDDDDLPF